VVLLIDGIYSGNASLPEYISPKKETRMYFPQQASKALISNTSQLENDPKSNSPALGFTLMSSHTTRQVSGLTRLN
jgi:hypothetical protein